MNFPEAAWIVFDTRGGLTPVIAGLTEADAYEKITYVNADLRQHYVVRRYTDPEYLGYSEEKARRGEWQVRAGLYRPLGDAIRALRERLNSSRFET